MPTKRSTHPTTPVDVVGGEELVALLDKLREKLGEKPTVEVSLQLGGGLIATPAELDRRL